MRWTEEFGIDCVTSEDTDWVSIVIELRTINVDERATSRWASQWRHLRKTWRIKEDELVAIRNILVIKSKLQLYIV